MTLNVVSLNALEGHNRGLPVCFTNARTVLGGRLDHEFTRTR